MQLLVICPSILSGYVTNDNLCSLWQCVHQSYLVMWQMIICAASYDCCSNLILLYGKWKSVKLLKMCTSIISGYLADDNQFSLWWAVQQSYISGYVTTKLCQQICFSSQADHFDLTHPKIYFERQVILFHRVFNRLVLYWWFRENVVLIFNYHITTS